MVSASLSRGEDSTGEEMIFFLITLTGLASRSLFCDRLLGTGTFLLTNIFLLLVISAAVTICIITAHTNNNMVTILLSMVSSVCYLTPSTLCYRLVCDVRLVSD